MTARGPLTGPRLWVATGVVAVATVVGVRTLAELLVPGRWVTATTVAVVAAALLTGALRSVTRSRSAPTAWALVATVIGVAAWYGGATTGPSVPRPTVETVERLRLAWAAGVRTVAEGRIPVEPTRGLEMLLVVGAVLAFLATELLAVGLARGAVAGVPLAALWAPVVTFERTPPTALLVLGGTAYLVLLALTRRRAARSDRSAAREAPVVVATAAGITAVALVVGTATTALPFHGAVRLPSGWGPERIDAPLRLSTDLDMRADLDSRSDRVLLTYTQDTGRIGPLRMYTVSDFDGQDWRRGESSDALRRAGGLLWPGAPDDAEAGEGAATVDVEVAGLTGDRLPIPAEPREVEATGAWLYDEVRDEVVGVGADTRGLSYSLRVATREISADGLREDAAGRAADEDLAVPASEHVADIRALAEQVTAEATTDYDRALALQMYLRSATNFTYDTQLAPARTTDAVWDFLTDRRGYCVQFATAMTIMARMVGIPARMAVGFLQGDPDPQVRGRFVVTAQQAHTWPELYFEDAGWVRFEPTPARQTGSPPLYADPFAGAPVSPEAPFPGGEATGGPSAAPTTAPGRGSAGTPEGYVSIGRADVPVGLVGTGIALVVLGIALLVVLRLRRRARAVARTPEDWWARLRERAEARGVTWSDATTPRQAAQVVRARYGAAAVDAELALDSLVAALETERYTDRPVTASPEQLAAWVDAVDGELAGATGEEEPARRVRERVLR